MQKQAGLEASIICKIMQASIEVLAFHSPVPETDTYSVG
jgi:hypothetical protein